MSDEKKLSICRVDVNGGWPRGKVILSDGSELDGVLSIGFKSAIMPLYPPVIVLEAILRGEFPGSTPREAAPRDDATQIVIQDDGIYIMRVSQEGRTYWTGPFRLVSDAGEPAPIFGFKGHFIQDFQSGFIL